MENGRDTRDRLIDAARELFLEQGYTATGIAQILKRAGARSGSLYHFFPTKEDLLFAVLERYRELLCPVVIQPVEERVTDPIERVFGILEGYRRMLQVSEFRWGCPIGNLALEVGVTHPNAARLLAANFSDWRDKVRGWIEDASGRLPEGTDTEALALFVLTTMEGAVMLARTYRSLDAYDTAVTLLRDYFDRLLAEGSDWGTTPREETRE
jgi:TetR/AcrR family transcriptional regulator, transcriptional repressor for nem operon